MTNNLIVNNSFLVVFHESISTGPSFDLRVFLLKYKVEKLLFISHPLLYNKDTYKNSSNFELYEEGKMVIKQSAYHWKFPEVFLYIKDFIYTIIWSLKYSAKDNIFIGYDPLNALAGLFLKKIGYTQKVVYYSIDYFTLRFKNTLLNRIYHSIDKFCVGNCDETWNVSGVMTEAREEYNAMDRKIYNRQYEVPIGIWFNNAPRKQFNEINKKKIIFVGILLPQNGVDLIIKAIPLILKEIPGLEVEILGGGPEEKKLKKLVRDYKVNKNVKFYGWVTDRKKVEILLSDAAIGLAPFNKRVAKDEIKNADPAKIKDYMLLGLPVITTDTVSSHKKLEKAKCSIIIPYDSTELAKAVINLLTDEKKLMKYRKNALSYVKQFDYEYIFKKSFKRLKYKLQ